MRSVRSRLDRYIVTEVLGPLALGFLVYTFILLIRFLFQSAEMIIRRGLPVSIVGELLLLTLPNIIVLTLPMSLLFGTLIAVGRLSSDSELIAMRACGVSLLTLYRPILLLSGLLTLVNTLLMVYALPWGNNSLQQLRLKILTQTVSQQVEPRVFYEEWEGKIVYVFEVPPGSKRWKGVFLAEAIPASQDNQITLADWGEILVDQAGERVVLRLYNATRHKVNLNAPDRYEMSRHKRLDLVLEDQFTSEQRAKISVSKGVRELTLGELRDLLDDPTAIPEQRNLARVEIHKKFSIPVACLVFGLFALPLGINNRRGGKASGFALSIGVLILYYVLLSNGEEAARYGRIPAWLAMWAPNILFSVLGVFLLLRRNRDKSLLLSRIDRWIRKDVWSGLLFLKKLRRARRLEQRRAAAKPRRSKPVPRVVLLLPRPLALALASLSIALVSLLLTFRLGRQGALYGVGILIILLIVWIVLRDLIDRYVVRLFASVFLLVVLSGISLFVIFDLSENIDEILKNKVGSGLVLNYYKYLSLQMFYEIAPIVVLVTTLMTFSLLARTNEITAMKALGMSLYRLSLPALAAALLVTFFCGYLESSVLPASNEKVAKLKDRIRGRETARTYRRADRQWLFGQGRYIYNYIHYEPAAAEPAAPAGVRFRRAAPAQPAALCGERALPRRRLDVQQRLGALVRRRGSDRLHALRGIQDRALPRDPGLLRLGDPTAGADALRRAEGVHPGAQGERPGRARAAGRAAEQDRAARGLPDHGPGGAPLRFPLGTPGSAIRDRHLDRPGDHLHGLFRLFRQARGGRCAASGRGGLEPERRLRAALGLSLPGGADVRVQNRLRSRPNSRALIQSKRTFALLARLTSLVR